MCSDNAYRFIPPAAVFVVTLLCGGTVNALQTTVTGEMSKMDGHTTSAIGGDFSSPSGSGLTWFPVSKLEFPLDIGMNIVKFGITTDDGLVVGLDVKKNANSKAGKMKRSDWPDSPSSLDVYSESDSGLDVTVYDLSFKVKKDVNALNVKKDVGVLMAGVGFGIRYQEFDYQVGNTVEQYPSTPGQGTKTTNGLTRTYNVQYIIPYISLSIHKPLSQQWLIGVDFGYSPFVQAKDKYHQLVDNPSTVSNGTTEGSMYSGLFFTRFIITKWAYIEGKLSYMAINTSGTQTQRYEGSGEWIVDIGTEITSEQYNFGLSYSVIF